MILPRGVYWKIRLTWPFSGNFSYNLHLKGKNIYIEIQNHYALKISEKDFFNSLIQIFCCINSYNRNYIICDGLSLLKNVLFTLIKKRKRFYSYKDY